jgi:hypothetical protein
MRFPLGLKEHRPLLVLVDDFASWKTAVAVRDVEAVFGTTQRATL